MSNDVGELDDLLTADVMRDVIEESTKEALEIGPEGSLGSSGKATSSGSGECDKNAATEKGLHSCHTYSIRVQFRTDRAIRYK